MPLFLTSCFSFLLLAFKANIYDAFQEVKAAYKSFKIGTLIQNQIYCILVAKLHLSSITIKLPFELLIQYLTLHF
jgi:hypothetical protein